MTTPVLKRLVILSVLSFASVAQAAIFKFETVLAPEVSGATGTGTSVVLYDDVARTLEVQINFSGLSGTTTVAHIHAPTAVGGGGFVGVAVTPGTLPAFPVGLTSGSYSTSPDPANPTPINLSLTGSYTGGFLTLGGGTAAGAEAALIAAFRDGKAYVNVHTSTFGGGEIRGFLKQVPDSSTTFALFGASVLALIALRRRVRI